MALESTQPLTEMSTRLIPGGKCGRYVRLTTSPPSCAVVMKSGNLNFLEPSGKLQACKGTALTVSFWICLCRHTFSQNLNSEIYFACLVKFSRVSTWSVTCTLQEAASQKQNFYCNKTPFEITQKCVHRNLVRAGRRIAQTEYKRLFWTESGKKFQHHHCFKFG